MAENSAINETSDDEIIIIEDNESDTVPTAPNEGMKMQCIFTWQIENFSYCYLDCGEELYSPMFSADSSARTRWFLSIYPNGNLNFSEYVSIHLIRHSIENDLRNAKLNCKISIIDAQCKVCHSKNIEQDFGVFGRFEFNTFIKRDDLFKEDSNILPEDILTITCHISAYDDKYLKINCVSSPETDMPCYDLLKKFSDDFKNLYESKKFVDIQLKLEDSNISAHKIVLAARSPVFSQMLHDSAQSQYLEIPDIKKDTMEALLSYIYYGKIDAKSAILSLQLYEAAEKYNIQELKRAITPSRIFARTQIIKEKIFYTWRIKYFSVISNGCHNTINSEKFHTGSSYRFWRLSLNFRANEKNDDIDIGINLNELLSNENKKSVYIQFKVYLLDRQEQPKHVRIMQKYFKSSSHYGFPTFMKRSTLLQEADDLLPADTLTIGCEMKVCDGTSVSTIKNSFSSTNTSLIDINDVKILSESFLNLFQCKMDSDVTVCSGSKKFFLHKTILCARSPVFADFFSSLTINKNPYTIDISGIKPKILEMLFHFIYTGEMVDLTRETAPGLYAAANHYKILDLKIFCSEFLKSHLMVSNACEIMALSHNLNDLELKNLVVDFICSHADELLITNQWRDFIREHESLSSEILKSLADVYRESKRIRLDV